MLNFTSKHTVTHTLIFSWAASLCVSRAWTCQADSKVEGSCSMCSHEGQQSSPAKWTLQRQKQHGKKIFFDMQTYHSRLWTARHFHWDSPAPRHRASAGGRRRGSPGSWRCLQHRSLSLQKHGMGALSTEPSHILSWNFLTYVFMVTGNDQRGLF